MHFLCRVNFNFVAKMKLIQFHKILSVKILETMYAMYNKNCLKCKGLLLAIFYLFIYSERKVSHNLSMEIRDNSKVRILRFKN